MLAAGCFVIREGRCGAGVSSLRVVLSRISLFPHHGLQTTKLVEWLGSF